MIVLHLLQDLLRVGQLARGGRGGGDELLEVGLRLRHLFRRQVGAAAIVVERVLGRELRHQLGDQLEGLVSLLIVDLADDDVHVRERILHLGEVQREQHLLAFGALVGLHQDLAVGELQVDVRRVGLGRLLQLLDRLGRLVLGHVGLRDRAHDLGPEGRLGLRILVEDA